jgi:hypothetical protein
MAAEVLRGEVDKVSKGVLRGARFEIEVVVLLVVSCRKFPTDCLLINLAEN